jgi:hypothetical protein
MRRNELAATLREDRASFGAAAPAVRGKSSEDFNNAQNTLTIASIPASWKHRTLNALREIGQAVADLARTSTNSLRQPARAKRLLGRGASDLGVLDNRA